MQASWNELWPSFLQALLPGSAEPLFFNTVLFAILFTALLAVNLLLVKQPRAREYVLLAFSLWFYYRLAGWVELPLSIGAHRLEVPFVAVMALTALAHWALGNQIAREQSVAVKRTWLILGLILALGILGLFKYRNFFDTLYHRLFTDGVGAGFAILFPVGISYYTFKSISYLMDLFFEEIETPEPDPLRHLLYVSFFPNILAGPITRATEFLPQLRKPFHLSAEDAGTGLFLFLSGMFKKAVIADSLGQNFVNRVFDNPGMFSGLENLLASFGFGLQLFADFSGYTDMAVGIALLLGFRLSGNFQAPFKALNISDFWRRWHTSLSSWFNDYVYADLAFQWRGWGKLGVGLAVLITFLLSGLWHGPNLTFVLWGSLHGLAIAWETVTRRGRLAVRRQLPAGLYNGVSFVLTMSFLGLTFLLFKADDLPEAGLMFSRIFTAFSGGLFLDWLVEYGRVAGIMALALALHYLPEEWKDGLRHWFATRHWLLQAALGFLAVVLIFQVQSADVQPFIYLKF